MTLPSHPAGAAGRRPPSVTLLDIDGTLVDSNDAHAEAWVAVLAEFGHRVEFARVRPLIGMGGDKVLPELTGIDAESEIGQRIGDRRSAIFKEQFAPGLKPTRGARRLLEGLRQSGLMLVVATSAKAEEVTMLLKAAGVDDLVQAASSSDDADRSKPDPDIIKAALHRAKCTPANAIMVGDTPYDIEAAARAGVMSIALRCGGWWKDDAFRGAAAVYDDPEALFERLGRSPLARPAPARSA